MRKRTKHTLAILQSFLLVQELVKNHPLWLKSYFDKEWDSKQHSAPQTKLVAELVCRHVHYKTTQFFFSFFFFFGFHGFFFLVYQRIKKQRFWEEVECLEVPLIYGPHSFTLSIPMFLVPMLWGDADLPIMLWSHWTEGIVTAVC